MYDTLQYMRVCFLISHFMYSKLGAKLYAVCLLKSLKQVSLANVLFNALLQKCSRTGSRKTNRNSLKVSNKLFAGRYR